MNLFKKLFKNKTRTHEEVCEIIMVEHLLESLKITDRWIQSNVQAGAGFKSITDTRSGCMICLSTFSLVSSLKVYPPEVFGVGIIIDDKKQATMLTKEILKVWQYEENKLAAATASHIVNSLKLGN